MSAVQQLRRTRQGGEPHSQPRAGLLGMWDQFVGPGATAGENLGTILFALVGVAGAPLLASLRGFDWSFTQYTVASLIAFDIAGGVWANSTLATRRWYHRSSQGFWQNLGFASLHIHPFLVAWLFRGNDWFFAIGNYSYLLIAFALVGFASRRLQRPLSVVLFAGVLLLNTYLWPPTAGLEWFIPLLFLKLLIGHAPAIETETPEEAAVTV